ncbi:TetR/AcrR family transcriptional regulator [Micromonospora sp. NBC_00898]|uniref:TetR/AcrR family transcriptional regulator n=1 Tax=Micromonospora sp. NBC_00898 TaxID=2975981 RepID=UPI003868107D|nr:TetR/AcrR family transcriptional regulator [Micromonospora sp. NBC_00898]
MIETSPRDRIVRAAAALPAEGGREAVTTRAVSRAAGVQAPTIYRQFGNLRGLLDAAASYGFATRAVRPPDRPVRHAVALPEVAGDLSPAERALLAEWLGRAAVPGGRRLIRARRAARAAGSVVRQPGPPSPARERPRTAVRCGLDRTTALGRKRSCHVRCSTPSWCLRPTGSTSGRTSPSAPRPPASGPTGRSRSTPSPN